MTYHLILRQTAWSTLQRALAVRDADAASSALARSTEPHEDVLLQRDIARGARGTLVEHVNVDPAPHGSKH